MYRRILKVHRQVLPSDLRVLGDSYAREEFVKHKKASSEELQLFHTAWEDYVRTLEEQRGRVRGRDLPEEKVERLSDSQLKQLALLRRESTRDLKGGYKASELGEEEVGHVHGPNCKH